MGSSSTDGSGRLIVFEGPEGAGKSTQVIRLVEHLHSVGYGNVLVTREPGGTPIGEQIRPILLDRANYAMLPETEALLYAAARAQHVRQVIQPALNEGTLVVCDRYIHSSMAYQSGGRGLEPQSLWNVQELATGGLMPDLCLLLDLPVSEGLARRRRASGHVDRLEADDLAFHERVRSAYHRMIESEPERWIVIDARAPIDEVTNQVVDGVMSRFDIWQTTW